MISSIVITNYNRSRYLPLAIESVLIQTYRDFELLIWDDGSTDGSAGIAQSYVKLDNRVQLVVSPNQGSALALKQAISCTRGKYVGWVDSDDYLAPTCLEKTVEVLNTNSDCGVVYTQYFDVDEKSNILGLGQRCLIPYSKELLLLQFMSFHFRLMRHEVYDLVGGINETYDLAKDYDLCLRLSEVAEFQHVPEPLYFYRRHGDSLSSLYKSKQAAMALRAKQEAIKRRSGI